MNSLASLQRAFQRHVCHGGRVMEQAVLATPRAGAARRLGIYADGYVSRLVGALAIDYPGLKGVLGETAFERVTREFVAAYPSRHANLRWYGGELPAFLARKPRWRRRPMLAELARFEWALGLAFDADDAVPTRAEKVAGLAAEDWPRLRLRLHPSVQRVRLGSHVPQIWQAATTGHEIPRSTMRRRPIEWLIWRKEHEPVYRPLSPEEAWAMGAVARGRDFATLCSGLRRFVGARHATQACVQFLRNWLSEQLVCGINPPAAGSHGRTSLP